MSSGEEIGELTNSKLLACKRSIFRAFKKFYSNNNFLISDFKKYVVKSRTKKN